MTELPFYEPTGNEISLFEHAFHQRLPLLIKARPAAARRASSRTWRRA
jgi:hypothetical protein